MSFHVMPRYLMRKDALKYILKKLQHEAGKNDLEVLEIGYGAGDIFNMYAELGLKAKGYDFSEKAYQTAKQQPSVKNGSAVLYTSWEEIPEESFDIVIASEVLEHIEDDKGALLKWKQYLKPCKRSGLIISVPAHSKRWGNDDILVGHFRRYEKNGLIKLLRSCQMRISDLYTYDFPSCLILDPLRDRRATSSAKQDISKEVRTKDSGVERDTNSIIRFLANPVFWIPIIKFQKLFFKTDLGSAYIFLARKDENYG